jgi:CelD/BcsL family acetyltransferase involved in cellulose biosynthesis
MSSTRTAVEIRPVDTDLERRWDELALSSGASPFARPRWLRAWMSAFGGTRDLAVLTVEDGGELAGVLPILPGRRRWSAPANSSSPIFSPVVADAQAAHRLAERLLAARSRATVDLIALPEGDGTLASDLLRIAESCNIATLRRTWSQSPYIDVSGDPADFTRGLSKNRRKSLRRLENRLRDAGEVSFEVLDGRENLPALLRDGFRLEAREWRRAEGSAILSRPATAQFHTAIAQWAADIGILRLAFLRVDGQPIAFGYCLQQGSTLYFWKVGMDDEYAALGPGVVLTERLIEYAHGQPDVGELDLLGQNERYKMDFATGTRTKIRLQVFPGGSLGRAQRASVIAAADLRRSLVSRLSKPTRARLSAVRNRLRPG